MEKDKSPANGGAGGRGGGIPPSGRYSSPFASPSSTFVVKSELPSSSSTPPNGGGGVTAAMQDGGQFSHDISRMPDYPPRNAGHRRAQSEILSLPDDINFDSDLGIIGLGEGPSLSDETEDDPFSMFIDVDKIMAASEGSAAAVALSPTPPGEGVALASNERPRIRHQHSQSMDGSTFIMPEALASPMEGQSSAEAKKAVSDAKLAELSLIDPKRAKRILANRQSAARSKERKMRYIAELERKVQTLQTEATTLSAQLSFLQRDTTGLTAENSELKLRLQTMEQQVRLQDALNDALREEIQQLKIATGQLTANGGSMMNFPAPSFGAGQQSYHHNHIQSLMAAHQFQQLQIHTQHQQQMHHPQQHHQNQMKGTMSSRTQSESTSDYAAATPKNEQ